MADNIKVAVRVRPFNNREKENKSKLVVRMDGNTTYLVNPETGKEKSFAFDYSFWSQNKADKHFVGQQAVFDKLGTSVLDNAFQGYNCTLFAYGQTGSGKSYSMVGEDNTDESFKSDGDSRGLIPRLCEGIFKKIDTLTNEQTTFTVEASMMEIYNEKIHDLLNPDAYGRGHGGGGVGELRIRESPTLGPYVEGLTCSAVKGFTDLMLLMAAGTRNRTIGATSMNHVSSRAHTIFTIILTQTTVDKDLMKAMDKVSRINLVDLAGSERQGKTEATGDRLKEGCAINKSLSALGHCITLIASGADDLDASFYDDKDPRKQKGGNLHIPYRDSVLTWLLSESLGGNAKTIMIAAISPADFNYAETMSTLRYAWQAKQIKTRAVINEDPNERLIRELREEIMQLRRRLGGDLSAYDDKSTALMSEQLVKSEEMIANLNKSWEQRLKETELKLKVNTATLQPMGGAIDSNAMEPNQPYLLNLHEDTSLTKNLAYPLLRYAVFGTDPEAADAEFSSSPPNPDTVKFLTLKGVGLKPRHCVFEVMQNRVTVSAIDNGRVCVNGKPLQPSERKELRHNDRVVLGMNHVFVVHHHPWDGTTPRRSATADWTLAMEEMLAGMQQKFFDPREQQKVEAELNAKMAAIREKETALEQERQKYQRMLLDIENEYKQYNRRRDAKLQSRLNDLEETLELEGRLGDLEEEREKLIAQIDEEDDDELTRLDLKKQRVIQQQLDVENILQSQNEKIRVFKAAKEKEKREVARAEEDIMHLIPLVDEANLMAEQMEKDVKYEVRLQSAVSPEVFEDPLTGQPNHKTQVEAAVSMIDLNTQHSRVWSYDKFMTRLYMMREVFEIFQQDPSVITSKDQDPFFDQGESQEIGKAHVWLMGLGHFIDTEDIVPIISKTGEQEGKLNVRLLIAEPSGKPNPLYYRTFASVERMIGNRLDLLIEIPGCQGLDPTRYSDVFARFKFYNDTNFVESKPFAKASSTPTLRFKRHVTIQPVDSGFVTYLLSDALTIEIWGTLLSVKPSTPVEKPKPQPLRSSKSNATVVRQKSNSLLLPKATSSMGTSQPVVKSLSLNRQAPVDEKAVEEISFKLRDVEEERNSLKTQVEVMATENQRIPVLYTQITDLTEENERLKSQIEALMAQLKHPNATMPFSRKSTPVRSPTVESLNGVVESKKSPQRNGSANSTSREDLARAHKERLEQMKKRFGS